MKIILSILISIILGTPSVLWSCNWKVYGRLEVKNDLFISAPGSNAHSQRVPISDVKVRLWASTLNSGGWASWGSTRSNSAGNYQIRKRPREADPIGCNKRRRFKIKLEFDGRSARVLNPGMQTQSYTFMTSKKDGKEVRVNKYLNTTVDDRNRGQTISTSYKATRAAQIYWAYRLLYQKANAWNVGAEKISVVWPDGLGNMDLLGWSAPGCCVRITRSWFWYKSDDTNVWVNIFDRSGYSWRRKWATRELTHEWVHQWFNKNAYIPNFTGGRTPGTHDFLETHQVTFYEEFAEFAAVFLNQEVFHIVDNNYDNTEILNRYGVYKAFKDARRPNGRPYYSDGRVLKPMIRQNSRKWKKDLYRAQDSVANYLRLLISPSWFRKSYGTESFSGTTTKPTRIFIDPIQYDCSDVSVRMFTPRQILHAISRWKNAFSNRRIPDADRGILGFYNYLGRRSNTYQNDFDQQKSLFFKLGNPHYAGKKDGIDACQKIL
ncbi:MAG: hypothetical protein ISR65_13405 [Bacteriovoracaceae bacterium]|nr:hypothetical protein [Bacteriovoracaceae bacterium]